MKKNTGRRAGAPKTKKSARIKVLNIPIDPVTTGDVLAAIERFMRGKTAHHIITVNPEIALHAQGSKAMMAALQESDLNTADGVGILWASYFLKKGQRLKSTWQKCRLFVASALAVVLHRKKIHSVIPERVTGVDLLERIAELAAQKGWSLFFLGGRDDAAIDTAAALQNRYHDLKIAGVYEGSPRDKKATSIVKKSKADILFVAYGSPQQEIFINENLAKFGAKVVIGVGGAFDFMAGRVMRAPQFMRSLGLEWLWRLINQPHRLVRILRATLSFSLAIFRSL